MNSNILRSTFEGADSSSSQSKISKYKPMPFVKSGQTLPTNILPSMEENTKEEEVLNISI
jgi:hypothetical protein